MLIKIMKKFLMLQLNFFTFRVEDYSLFIKPSINLFLNIYNYLISYNNAHMSHLGSTIIHNNLVNIFYCHFTTSFFLNDIIIFLIFFILFLVIIMSHFTLFYNTILFIIPFA